MKKALIALMVLVIALAPLAAQSVTVGPKVSVGTSSLRGKDWDDVLSDYGKENRLNPSFSAGLTIMREFTPVVGIQADLLYARFGSKYGDNIGWLSENWSSINLPVYSRFTFALGSMNIYALAGVDLNLLFGDVMQKDNTGDSGTIGVSDYYDSTFWFGIALGTGVTLPMDSGAVDIGIRYRTNLNEMETNTYIYSQSLLLDFAYRFAL